MYKLGEILITLSLLPFSSSITIIILGIKYNLDILSYSVILAAITVILVTVGVVLELQEILGGKK